MMELFIKIATVVCFTAFSVTHFSVTSWTQADIVDLKDLIDDADNAVWTNIDGNELTMDSLTGLNRVSRGAKLGGIHGSFNPGGVDLLINKSISKNTVDVRVFPQTPDRASALRGTYNLDLPNLKRVQLEVRYDSFLDSAGNVSPLQFYVEVQKRDESGNFNVDLIEDGGANPLEPSSPRIFRIEKNAAEIERFTSKAFIVDLSEYAGEPVKLSLVSFLPPGIRASHQGRWVNARLVGATFTFHFEGDKTSTSK